MTRDEKNELLIILNCFLFVFLFRNDLPKPTTLATVVLSLSALLLLQSLIRDVWYLSIYSADEAEPKKTMPGICLESFIGGFGIIVGGILLFSYHAYIQSEPFISAFSVLIVLLFGLWVKDYVLDFSNFTIHKDKQHMNILIGRKRSN